MSENQKKQLEAQLWGIANQLRGKISADDYRDYILGFIFYKYLGEKQYLYANKLLESEKVTDEFVVMPNHIHGILIIDGNNIENNDENDVDNGNDNDNDNDNQQPPSK